MNLFKPIIPVDKMHPNFFRIYESSDFEEERKLIQSWSDDFIDRDNKFVKEFQTSFNSCFWELYLHASFRELGYIPNYSHQAPDFCLTGQEDIIVEATIASQPYGFIPEWEKDISDPKFEIPDPSIIVELASIRLANSIYEKSQKYLNSYNKLSHVQNKPYIVAVAPYEQPFFFYQSDQAISRVLYGYDQVLWTENHSTGERLIIGESRVESTQKHSGTKIDFGFFTKPDFKHISAIIFSPLATWGKARALSHNTTTNTFFEARRYAEGQQHATIIKKHKKDYTEHLLDGMHLFLNPYAERTIDITSFNRKEISIHYFNEHVQNHITDTKDGFLFSRQLFTINTVDKFDTSKHPRQHGPSAYKAYENYTFPENTLFEVKGHTHLTLRNFIAHYKKWTLIIYQDACDLDWGGQAIQYLCTDLGTYMRKNSEDSIRTILMPDFYSEKDIAFENLKSLIDADTIASK